MGLKTIVDNPTITYYFKPVITLNVFSSSGCNISRLPAFFAAKNPSGWSMYVGSSWDSSGQWRPYHNDNMRSICEKSLAQKNYNECHAELQSAAITNYKNYGALKSTRLFIKKLYHQAEEQNYFYNAENSITGYTGSRTFKLIKIYSAVFMFAVFILSAKFLYLLAKRSVSNQTVSPILLLITLIMIGWFFALMFVESAPRYSTILYPAFIIFSVLILDHKYGNNIDNK